MDRSQFDNELSFHLAYAAARFLHAENLLTDAELQAFKQDLATQYKPVISRLILPYQLDKTRL